MRCQVMLRGMRPQVQRRGEGVSDTAPPQQRFRASQEDSPAILGVGSSSGNSEASPSSSVAVATGPGHSLDADEDRRG